MKKILIATDGSPSAREVVTFGIDLAAEQRAEAFVVHVVPAFDLVPMMGFGMPAAQRHPIGTHDWAALEDASTLAAEVGVDVETEVLTGDPVDEIVAYADSINADMIVLGSRGHGSVASAILGSVSQGVLHEARRPVLVVRGVRGRMFYPTVAAVV